MAYITRELNARTLSDFELLAAKQGECWCMFYQRPRPVGRGLSSVQRKALNRRDKARLVRGGHAHAILVYEGKAPVGWCQYGPREELPRVDAGRGYRKVGPPAGEERVWRITCFFVDRDHRGKGVATIGLRAALESIKKRGGGIVEAFPVVSQRMAAVPEWRWFGTKRMFEREGFAAVAPLGTSGLLMRKTIRPVAA
jgi:GNAT superfamily N-acetyltransferase